MHKKIFILSMAFLTWAHLFSGASLASPPLPLTDDEGPQRGVFVLRPAALKQSEVRVEIYPGASELTGLDATLVQNGNTYRLTGTVNGLLYTRDVQSGNGLCVPSMEPDWDLYKSDDWVLYKEVLLPHVDPVTGMTSEKIGMSYRVQVTQVP